MSNNLDTSQDEFFIAADGKKYRKVMKTFGELEKDNLVMGSHGQPTRIFHAFEEHMPEATYEIETDEGTTIRASGNHLWYAIPNTDRDLYHYRLRLGKKLKKKLSSEAIAILEDAIEAPAAEISVRTMIDALGEGLFKDNQFSYAVLRVAEGVGPVAERNYFVDYLDDDDDKTPQLETTVAMYDSKRFSQQLLSFFNVKKYRKQFPLLVGRVMTTEELFEFEPGEVFIPDPS